MFTALLIKCYADSNMAYSFINNWLLWVCIKNTSSFFICYPVSNMFDISFEWYGTLTPILNTSIFIELILYYFIFITWHFYQS